MIRDGYLCGLTGVPHTKNPHRQWAGAHTRETSAYYRWLHDWQRGRRVRLASHRGRA